MPLTNGLTRAGLTPPGRSGIAVRAVMVATAAAATTAAGVAAGLTAGGARADPPTVEVPEARADAVRKARILAGDRWRRAMFEFDAWLDDQPVYSPAEARRIRGELAARVAGMSSFELEYLLDSMDAKLRVLESPEARDARAWLGRYLAVMSDARRAATLRTVPDVLDMTAADLEAAVETVEARRAAVERRHAETLAASLVAARFRQSAAAATAAERARLTSGRTPSFSPYRGTPVGAAPFAEAYDSPTVVGSDPWNLFVRSPIGAF